MSGGRGHTLLYLSEGSHWRSFKDGPTSLSTTVIPPQSRAVSCPCQRRVPTARPEKMSAAWQGCDLEKRTCRARHLLKDAEGDSLVEILSQGNTTCSLLSV